MDYKIPHEDEQNETEIETPTEEVAEVEVEPITNEVGESISGEEVQTEIPSNNYEVTPEAKRSTTYLDISPNNISFSYDEGNKKINVYTDGLWEISSYPASWCECHITENTISVNVDANTGNNRTTTLKIKSGNIVKSIKITQRSQYIACWHCRGYGAFPCSYSAAIYDYSSGYHYVQEFVFSGYYGYYAYNACPLCGGTGRIKCETCNGTGKVKNY